MAKSFGHIPSAPDGTKVEEVKVPQEGSAPTVINTPVSPTNPDESVKKALDAYNQYGEFGDGTRSEPCTESSKIIRESVSVSSGSQVPEPTAQKKPTVLVADEEMFNKFQEAILAKDPEALSLLSKSQAEVMSTNPELARALNSCICSGMTLQPPSGDTDILEDIHTFSSMLGGDLSGIMMSVATSSDDNTEQTSASLQGDRAHGPSSSPPFDAESSAAATEFIAKAALAGPDENYPASRSGPPSVLGSLASLALSPFKKGGEVVTKAEVGAAVKGMGLAASEYNANPSDETFSKYVDSSNKLAQTLGSRGKLAAAKKILENTNQDIEKAPISEETRKSLVEATSKLLDAIMSVISMIFSRNQTGKDGQTGPTMDPGTS